MTRYIRIICLCLIINNSNAQLPLQDSLFMNAIFANYLYANVNAFTGTFYIYDSITSKAHLFSSLDSVFKFSSSDVKNSFKKIKLLSDTIPLTNINMALNYYYSLNPLWGMSQLNPFFKINYLLNNTVSSTYTAITPTTLANTETAYLVIPGSGENVSTDFLTEDGYHNLYCDVKNTLASTGDVFTYSRPLQDHRSIRWRGAGVMCDYPNPSLTLCYLRES